jgi:hypothetical protein
MLSYSIDSNMLMTTKLSSDVRSEPDHYERMQEAIQLAEQPLEDLMQQEIIQASVARMASIEANVNKAAVYPNASAFQAELAQEKLTQSKLLENLMNRSAVACRAVLEPFNLPAGSAQDGSRISGRHAWNPGVSGVH